MTTSRHYRWIVVLLTMVFQAVSVGILIYSFALFVVPWLDTFPSPRRNIMLAIVALQLSTGAMSPLSGRALDNSIPGLQRHPATHGGNLRQSLRQCIVWQSVWTG